MKLWMAVSLVLGLMLVAASSIADTLITMSGHDWSITFPDATWKRQTPPEKKYYDHGH